MNPSSTHRISHPAPIQQPGGPNPRNARADGHQTPPSPWQKRPFHEESLPDSPGDQQVQPSGLDEPAAKKARRSSRAPWAAQLQQSPAATLIDNDDVSLFSAISFGDNSTHDLFLPEPGCLDQRLNLDGTDEVQQDGPLLSKGGESDAAVHEEPLTHKPLVDNERGPLCGELLQRGAPEEAAIQPKNPRSLSPTPQALNKFRPPCKERGSATVSCQAPTSERLNGTAVQTHLMRPALQAEVIEHKKILLKLDFTNDQIASISHRPDVLGLTANGLFTNLVQVLPELTRDRYCDLATRSHAAENLNALLKYAQDLKTARPHFTAAQLFSITQKGGSYSLKELHALCHQLSGPGFGLLSGQLTHIAYHNDGDRNLRAVRDHMHELTGDPYNVDSADVARVGGRPRGYLALQELRDHLPLLTQKPYFLSRKEVVTIACSFQGGGLKEFMRHMGVLTGEPYFLDVKDLLSISPNRRQILTRLQAFTSHLHEMTSEPYSLAPSDVLDTYLL